MADPDPTTPPPPQKQVEIQVVYFNGFAIGFSAADMGIRIQLDNQPILELKTSFTTIKTLAKALTETIERFERVTSHNIMTSSEVAKAIADSKKPKDNQS